MTQPNAHAIHCDWDRHYPIIVRAESIHLFDANG
jgi:hypothetical protein